MNILQRVDISLREMLRERAGERDREGYGKKKNKGERREDRNKKRK